MKFNDKINYLGKGFSKMDRENFCLMLCLDFETLLPLCPVGCSPSNRHILMTLSEFQQQHYIKNKTSFEIYNQLLNFNFQENFLKTTSCPFCREVFEHSNCCEESANGDVTCPRPNCRGKFCQKCGHEKHHYPVSCEEVGLESVFSRKVGEVLVDLMDASEASDDDTEDDSDDIAPVTDYTDLITKIYNSKEQIRSKMPKVTSKSWQKSISKIFSPKNLKNFQKFKSSIKLDPKIVNQIIDKHQEKLSLKTIHQTCLSCPFCFIPIEKIEGCSFMTCTNCDNKFLYRDYDVAKGPRPDQFSQKMLERGPRHSTSSIANTNDTAELLYGRGNLDFSTKTLLRVAEPPRMFEPGKYEKMKNQMNYVRNRNYM